MIATEASQQLGDHPQVSVVMANFNGGAYLAEAVESVQNQTLRDLELIVSDDASTDNSIDIVTRLRVTDQRIRLLRSDRNGGPAAARNRAIAVAGGQWIAIMDSDDKMHPERLSRLVAAATKDGAELVADDLVEFRAGDLHASRRLLQGNWGRRPFWVDVAEYVELNRLYGPGPALGYLKPLIRASALRECSVAYDETLRIAEDYNLILRLLHCGKAMRVYPLPLYYYRRHATSISHRLNERALIDLKAADLRFLATIPAHHMRLARAVQTKIKSTEVALSYERLLESLKTGSWWRAVILALREPRAALLLRLPLGDRLRRLVSRVQRALSASAHHANIYTSRCQRRTLASGDE
jgi:GT2 family glycosyltransferase